MQKKRLTLLDPDLNCFGFLGPYCHWRGGTGTHLQHLFAFCLNTDQGGRRLFLVTNSQTMFCEILCILPIFCQCVLIFILLFVLKLTS